MSNDKWTLGMHQEEFGEHLLDFLMYAKAQGYKWRLRELQRTADQQKLYVQQGKSWTMNSMHINSTAIDIYFFKDGKLVESPTDLGKYWEGLNERNRAGMFWKKKDSPHYERKI